MKRFIATLFAVAVFAQGDENSESDCDTDECMQAEEGWGAFKDWVKSEQDPVEFTSITATSNETPCLLGGYYGWYQTLGVDYVFIREELS